MSQIRKYPQEPQIAAPRTDGTSPGVLAIAAGRRLRDLRDRLGMTLRMVEEASTQLAELYGNPEFCLPPSRLSDIETKGVLPSLYRLHSLSIVYKLEWRELLMWYGIDLGMTPPLAKGMPDLPRTHRITNLPHLEELQLPLRLDPGVSRCKTMDIGRMVEQWGVLPMTYLATFAHDSYVYGYIGSEDFTMHPILPPGSFVQVDQTRIRVERGLARSDYARPIYFIETHEEYLCAWCSVRDGKLIVQPHPLSGCEVRIFRHPQEAEIIGQVVGAAIRLAEDRYPEDR